MFQFTQNESTASRRRIYFYAVDVTDGYTAVTTGLGVGGSTTVEIFKNGVVAASPISPTFTHLSRGLWYYEFTALSGYLDTVGVLNVVISDALIRTVQLIGYVYAGDPLASSSISAADVWTYGTRDLTGSVAVASIANNAITAASITDGVIASEVWGALLASYTTANTFGARVVRTIASPATNEVTINVSNHIAANVHQMQNNTITAAAIATNAIDADALATDAVTEIVNGVWSRDPSDALFNGLAGYWLYQAGLNSQAIVSDTNTIAGTPYIESIGDALLNRNVGGGSNSGRLVKEALYALRNKSEIVGNTLSVYNAVDALSWTATVASSASADPVTGIDP
jgi:hypothetical protein